VFRILPDAIPQNLHESGIIDRGNRGWIPHCLLEAADAWWRLSEPVVSLVQPIAQFARTADIVVVEIRIYSQFP
jgi:hypothetical protein